MFDTGLVSSAHEHTLVTVLHCRRRLPPSPINRVMQVWGDLEENLRLVAVHDPTKEIMRFLGRTRCLKM